MANSSETNCDMICLKTNLAISFKGYLTLDDKTKIKVFEQFSDNLFRLTSPFNSLWYDLFSLGQFNNRIGFTTDKIPFPKNNISKLRGTSFLSNPSSSSGVRIVLFKLLNTTDNNGPIVGFTDSPNSMNGFALQTYATPLHYKISWLSRSKDINLNKKMKIGFYTSDDFRYGRKNNLYLICGNRGASLFDTKVGQKGTFSCQGVLTIYVAINSDVTDQEVEILLKIEAIKPEVWSFPEIAVGKPYTKYLTIEHHDKFYKLPVYTMTANSNDTYIKAPSFLFKQTAALINAYLSQTSLSILLWETIPTNNNNFTNSTNFNNLLSFTNSLKSIIPNKKYPVPSTSPRIGVDYTYWSMNTISFGNTLRVDAFFGTFYGFQLTVPRGRLPVIHYTIDVNNKSNRRIPTEVNCQWMDYFSAWDYHERVNPQTGQVVGLCRDFTGLVEPNQSKPLTGSFVLKNDAIDFCVSLYSRTNLQEPEKITVSFTIELTFINSPN